MKNIKSLSIISLTYNNWPLLESAFKSVGEQNIPENCYIEYFVVDDGSNDFQETKIIEMANRYHLSEKMIFVVIRNPENVGTVKSFNGAIQRCKGEIIIPLSADDYFAHSDVLKSIYKEFNYGDRLIVTGLRVPVVNGIKKSNTILPEEHYHYLFDHGNDLALLKQLCLKKNVISGSSTYYHRDVFYKIGLFDESFRLLEDFPFYEKALLNDVRIHLLKERTLFYSTHGISHEEIPNPLLAKDYAQLTLRLSKNPRLNFWERRRVVYGQVLNRKQRYEPINMIIYFDCWLARKLSKIHEKLVISKLRNEDSA